jgi:streptogramin lyase
MVSGEFPMPPGALAVRAGLGAIWVTSPSTDELLHVDPVSGEVVAEIKVGAHPRFLAVGEGSVWTMNQEAGTVSRVDPISDQEVATIDLGEPVRGGDIAVGGGLVWLRGSGTLLAKIDPASNQIVARYGPNAGSGGVAANADAVWATVHDRTSIWRVPLP